MSNNFILAFLYQYIYLFIVTILTIPIIAHYLKMSNVPKTKYISDNRQKALLLAVFMAIFIGLRPIHEIFVDMPQYLGIFERFSRSHEYLWEAENFIYDNLMFIFASMRVEPVFFYLLISCIYFICSFISCCRIFKHNALCSYLVFLAAFSTFSYGTNGIKAGAAAVLFLMALSYRDNLKVCCFWMFVSLGFHHSMVVPITAFALTLFFKNPKYYFWGWIFCAVMAFAHVSFFQNIFSGLADDKGAGYLGATGFSENTFLTGFRPDFMLYSAMPVWVGYLAKFKKGIQSKMYDTLLYTYMASNGVWMLCMYASFTNRIAYLSWSIYPMVLIYPFFNSSWGMGRYKTFAIVMGWHLAFTLFMTQVYYGGLSKLINVL